MKQRNEAGMGSISKGKLGEMALGTAKIFKCCFTHLSCIV